MTHASTTSVAEEVSVSPRGPVNTCASASQDGVANIVNRPPPAARSRHESTIVRTAAAPASLSRWPSVRAVAAPAAVVPAKPSGAKCV